MGHPNTLKGDPGTGQEPVPTSNLGILCVFPYLWWFHREPPSVETTFGALSSRQVSIVPMPSPLVRASEATPPITSPGSAAYFPSPPTYGQSDLPTTYCFLVVISPLRLGLASF